MSRPEIERQILEDVRSQLQQLQPGFIWDKNSVLVRMVSALAYAVALAIDSDTRRQLGHREAGGVSASQHNALVEAFKILGNQVAEHNAALQAMAVPAPVPERTHWICYCGWKNAAGSACAVCGNKPSP